MENITEWSIFYVFNFSSATRGLSSNVSTILASIATWLKTTFQLMKDGLVIK